MENKRLQVVEHQNGTWRVICERCAGGPRVVAQGFKVYGAAVNAACVHYMREHKPAEIATHTWADQASADVSA